MNKDMMKKNVGSHVLLVPPACRLNKDGFELAAVEDDWWLVQSVADDGVTISDPRTGHCRLLGYDHIYKFTSDGTRKGPARGFLSLHVQLTVQGSDVRVVPNARPGEPVKPREPEVRPQVVQIGYPDTSGMQAKLTAEGFTIGWARAERVHGLKKEGYEEALEPDGRGGYVALRTRDGLVLLKHRTN